MDFNFHELKDAIYSLHKSIAFFAICFVIASSLSGCYRSREKEYYLDKSNYVTCEAVVKNTVYKEENQAIYLWLTPAIDVYSDTTFSIKEKNLEIFIANGGLELLTNGKTITFTSAPRYFGDGYIMPIVAISCDDVILLDFEIGYNNLMESYGVPTAK